MKENELKRIFEAKSNPRSAASYELRQLLGVSIRVFNILTVDQIHKLLKEKRDVLEYQIEHKKRSIEYINRFLSM